MEKIIKYIRREWKKRIPSYAQWRNKFYQRVMNFYICYSAKGKKNKQRKETNIQHLKCNIITRKKKAESCQNDENQYLSIVQRSSALIRSSSTNLGSRKGNKENTLQSVQMTQKLSFVRSTCLPRSKIMNSQQCP